jgi:hypothetical protein
LLNFYKFSFHEAKYISVWLCELSNACPPTAPCTYSGNLLQSVYHALLYIHVLLLLLFYYCWCYYTSPPPYHLAQVRQRADIYIYINTLCQEHGGEGSEYITKREKGERGRRAESRKWWNENEHLSVSLVRIYQNSVTKFQILSFERFPWIFLPPL